MRCIDFRNPKLFLQWSLDKYGFVHVTLLDVGVV